MITKPQIDSISRAVRGRPFQFDFSEIVIRGQADFDDPYFKGPGIVSGDIDGPLKFSMFDQLGNPAGSAAITRAMLAKEPMRFFGTDMDGLEWAGGYFFPAARISTGGQHKISGELKQLSTGISQQLLPHYKNTTALYYSENLSLPMVDATRTQIVPMALSKCNRLEPIERS